MARKSAFGQIKTPSWWKKKHKPSEHYYEVSYLTPIEGLDKWPNSAKRQYKPNGARTLQEAQDWLSSEEKR